jgi:aldose 1-epimerase
VTGETPAPSGEQIELQRGEQTATAVSVGAGIRSYRVGDRDVLDGYPVTAMADGARGQTLMPWPNRVRDGKWSWNGQQLQLALTEPEQHNAIHGLVRWLGWSVLDRGDDHVTFASTSWPQIGYQWPLDLRVRYSLTDTGLVVEQSITNRGTSAAPVAAGAHPYLTVGTPTVDDVVLHVPAEKWLPTGDQQIPTGTENVEGSPFDFRTPRPIGDLRIDYTFTGLQRDSDARFSVRLQHPEEQHHVSLWLDSSYPYVEIFTGDALPDESRRRRGLGIEPMTAPPNGLAMQTDLCVLRPGETWTGRWGITASQNE